MKTAKQIRQITDSIGLNNYKEEVDARLRVIESKIRFAAENFDHYINIGVDWKYVDSVKYEFEQLGYKVFIRPIKERYPLSWHREIEKDAMLRISW